MAIIFITPFALLIAIVVGVSKSLRTKRQYEFTRKAPAHQQSRRSTRTKNYSESYRAKPSSRQRTSTTVSNSVEPCSTTLLRSIHDLNWFEFELLCKTYFEKRGYKAIHTPATADGGIDLILYNEDGKKLVQAKSFKKWVGVKYVRELLGVVTSEGSSSAIFVSRNGFSPDAKEFANKNHIELIDGGTIMRFFGASSEYFVTPELIPGEKPVLCPRCSLPMVVRVSKSGPSLGEKFYGCSRFPTCHGTRKFIDPPLQQISA